MFFRTAAVFVKRKFFKKAIFRITYSCWRATFSEWVYDLTFHSRYFFRRAYRGGTT